VKVPDPDRPAQTPEGDLPADNPAAESDLASADFETQYHTYVPPKWHARGEILAVTAILALALALRIIFTYQVHESNFHAIGKLREGTDSVTYDSIARWVIANGWFEKSADVSPLYPYVFLPGAYLLTQSKPSLDDRAPLWPLFLQGCLDTMTVLLVYILAKRLYGIRTGIFAALGAAVYAPFIVYQGQILGETLLNFLVAAFFVVLLAVSKKLTLKRAAAMGALLALCVAAKPTAVVFLPLALAWIWRESGLGFRGAWRLAAPVAVMAAAFAAVVLPLGYRNYRATGEFLLIRGNSGVMLYMGNNPSATGAYSTPWDQAGLELDAATRQLPLSQKDRIYRDAALKFIREHPAQTLKLLWRKFLFFFSAPEIPNNLSVTLYRQTTFLKSWVFPSFGFIFPFAVAGFALSIRDRGVWLIAAQVMTYAAAIVAFIVVDRYRLAVVPLLLPAAGYAASEIVLAFKSLELRRTVLIAIVAGFAAVLVNRQDLATIVTQRLNPDGIVDHFGTKAVIRDDSDYGSQFNAALFNQDSEVTKFIMVHEPLDGVTRAAVAVLMSVPMEGELKVSLNDFETRMVMRSSQPHWEVFSFPASAVREGTNRISISTDGQCRARVFADDVFNFGRSVYSPDGRSFMMDLLDQVSYGRSPSLHIGGHEFKVRLELDYPETRPR